MIWLDRTCAAAIGWAIGILLAVWLARTPHPFVTPTQGVSSAL